MIEAKENPQKDTPIRITKTNGETVKGVFKASWNGYQFHEYSYHKGYEELDCNNVNHWLAFGESMDFILHESKICLDDKFIKIDARGYSSYVESVLSKCDVIKMARFLGVTAEELGG